MTIIVSDYNKAFSVEIPNNISSDKGLEKSLTLEVRWNRGEACSMRYGLFTLSPMPGCCGIVVSTESFVDVYWRGRGDSSKMFHKFKAQIAKVFGYKVMIMTTQLRNFPEVIGAAKSNWKFVHAFRNPRTDNDIGIAVKEIL